MKGIEGAATLIQNRPGKRAKSQKAHPLVHLPGDISFLEFAPQQSLIWASLHPLNGILAVWSFHQVSCSAKDDQRNRCWLWSVQMHQREKAMRTDMWQRNAMEASACSHEYFDPCFIESWTAMAFLRPFSDLAEHRLTAVNTEPITN